MTTSNGSDKPLYPFNWLDAVSALAWAPPNLPLYDGVTRSGWDRFPLASSESTRSADPESPVAPSSPSALNLWPKGGAIAASDLPLDGPRIAPVSWDSFPLAQTASNRQFGNARNQAPSNDNRPRAPRDAACTAASYECLSHIGVPPSEPITPFDAQACQIAEDLCNRYVNSRVPGVLGFTKFPDATVVVGPPPPRQPYVVPSKYFSPRPPR